jgi:hypothetical protein
MYRSFFWLVEKDAPLNTFPNQQWLISAKWLPFTRKPFNPRITQKTVCDYERETFCDVVDPGIANRL